jgi:tetratricopeptide (TPR) repeat protein
MSKPQSKARTRNAPVKIDPWKKDSHGFQAKSQPQASKPNLFLLTILIIIVSIITLMAHWPVLSAHAFSFDDDQYLKDNCLVKNPSWGSAGRFFTEVLTPSTVGGYYQPLAMISLMLDYAMGGRENNLSTFHRTSLILHLLNTSLIIIFLYLLFHNCWIAALTGLLFGVHPMTVEPMAWISERKTLLAAFFALLSLVLYLGYIRKSNTKFKWGALGAYVMALMSKPTSTPLPILFLLLDYWPIGRLNRKTILEKIPFLAVGTISALITYFSQENTAGVQIYHGFQFLLIPCHNILFYLSKFFWPVNLSSYYPFPAPFSLTNPSVFLSVIGACLLLAILIYSLRWTKGFFTGGLFLFFALIPTMGGIQFNDVIASDKYAYLPLTGILLVLCWVLTKVWRKKTAGSSAGAKYRIPIIQMGIILVIGILAVAEIVTVRNYLVKWRNSGTLYGYMLKLAPQTPSLHFCYGKILSDNGQFDEAISHFKETIRLDPNYTLAYNNMGIIMMDRKQWDQAVDCFSKAIKTGPGFDQAYGNLGIILFSQGKCDQAMDLFRKAVELAPYNPDNCYNLASSLFQASQWDEAIFYFSRVIELNPGHTNSYLYLGLALTKQGKMDEASARFQELIRREPENANAHYYLGQVLSKLGRNQEAAVEFEKALKINPNLSNMRN